MEGTEDAGIVGDVLVGAAGAGEEVEEGGEGDVLGRGRFAGLEVVEECATEFDLVGLLQDAEEGADEVLLFEFEIVEEVGLDTWWIVEFCFHIINNVFEVGCLRKRLMMAPDRFSFFPEAGAKLDKL